MRYFLLGFLTMYDINGDNVSGFSRDRSKHWKAYFLIYKGKGMQMDINIYVCEQYNNIILV